LPEYLLNFKEKIKYDPKRQLEAYKSGDYSIVEEEFQMNKLRMGVLMGN